MAITKITTPELIDLPFNNTDGVVLPKGTTTAEVTNVEYLVVAGGGGTSNYNSGGGGAGGLLNASITMNDSITYSITIGEGGAAVNNTDPLTSTSDGDDSTLNGSDITLVTTTGGGRAGLRGTSSNNAGGNGGSGGGGGSIGSGGNVAGSGNTPSTTPSQGKDGGVGANLGDYRGGGGGGAGAAGGSSASGGNGGVGLDMSLVINNTNATSASVGEVSGSSVYFAGGGGAGANSSPGSGGLGGGGDGGTSSPADQGTEGTGGGGGGGSYPNALNAAKGGRGVVILRYAATRTITTSGFTAEAGPYTEGDYKVLVLKEGTGTVVFSNTPLPVGRPSTPTNGEFRYNTTTKKVEYYDGANWFALNSSRASGQPFNSFNPVIYTGNGSTQNITTGFNPDFGMFKARDAVGPWSLQDSVSGNFYFRSNASDAGAATNGYNVTSWTTSATEITVKDDANGGYNINGSPGGLYAGNGTYVGYVWKAGGAATTIPSGTNGSTIASDVSANIGAGFSIVKYTTAGTQTISHGLSEAPQIIINKISDASVNWNVYTQTTGTGNLLKLNLTDASASDSVFMTAVGANTFTTKWSDGTYDYINYCWHSVPGFSKIGSYTWTGTSYTAGTMVTGLGFTPSLVMIKSYSAGNDNWFIFDNKRVSGTQSYAIYPNLTDAERTTGYQGIIFDSDGFSAGAGADGNITGSDGLNLNGRSYIYMAFAAE